MRAVVLISCLISPVLIMQTEDDAYCVGACSMKSDSYKKINENMKINGNDYFTISTGLEVLFRI